jgi:spore coat polysaccharide biosynthesis protein SpsF
MKTAITITARMKSKRLPLKVMRYIEGKPMIEHLIDRLKLSKFADEIIMCTSTNPQDDILIDVAEKEEIKWFKGNEEDVLDRMFNAAKKFNIDFIVSTTADNPLVDPIYIDKIIQKFRETNADYITCKKLPLGAFSYGIKVKALKKVIELKKEKDTEIWGRFFEEIDEFKKIELEVEDELNHPEIRLTVDEKEDFKLIRKIFDNFYSYKNDFKLKEVVKYLLDNSDLMNINKSIVQRKK